jgi:hypothetical protein
LLPTYTTPSTTAGLDVTSPFVYALHNFVPSSAFNAYTDLSLLPTYTTPSTTAGLDVTVPRV